jgi:sterol 3beta-glucosyltransferase
MRIAIITVGTRGDVQPHLALAAGLQSAGHRVRLATHAEFEPMVRAYGVDFYPMAGSPQALVSQEAGHAWLEQGDSLVGYLRGMLNAAGPLAGPVMRDTLAACRDVDAVFYSVLGMFLAFSVAEKLGLPAYPAFVQPLPPTRAFPNIMMPVVPGLNGWYNRLSHDLAAVVVWQLLRPVINRARREQLDLAPVSRRAPFFSLITRAPGVLLGFSEAVVPRPPDWSGHVHVTGYWFLPAPPDWSPPPALEEFLAAGPPPVYVGFGSMATRDPAATARTVLDALAHGGRRGILQRGWGGLDAAHVPPGVFLAGSLPHDWLFSRVSAVVHHGGAGTTATGLRAGAPTVVVPFIGDQPFWGRRVAAIGAGPAPLTRDALTPARLAAALDAAHEPRVRAQAAAIGARLRAEDGVAAAVAALRSVTG